MPLLDKRKKNGLTQANFNNHPMQACAQGVKARLVNLRWDAVFSRVIGLLSDAHLFQSLRVYFAREIFRRGGRRW